MFSDVEYRSPSVGPLQNQIPTRLNTPEPQTGVARASSFNFLEGFLEPPVRTPLRRADYPNPRVALSDITDAILALQYPRHHAPEPEIPDNSIINISVRQVGIIKIEPEDVFLTVVRFVKEESPVPSHLTYPTPAPSLSPLPTLTPSPTRIPTEEYPCVECIQDGYDYCIDQEEIPDIEPFDRRTWIYASSSNPTANPSFHPNRRQFVGLTPPRTTRKKSSKRTPKQEYIGLSSFDTVKRRRH